MHPISHLLQLLTRRAQSEPCKTLTSSRSRHR
ncbi:hypothetical protein WG66_001842 [Moniliophthora roreri]|nr:hypothetical protein WG66_001842 [Moniliophthora roreri]